MLTIKKLIFGMDKNVFLSACKQAFSDILWNTILEVLKKSGESDGLRRSPLKWMLI